MKVSEKRTCVIDNGIELGDLLAVAGKEGRKPFVVFGIMGRLVAVKDHRFLAAGVLDLAAGRRELPS